MDPANPLIVQSDRTVLLEVASPKAGDARVALARFAELEKSPEHMHTYRLTPLSLWNAASAGLSVDTVAQTLQMYAKYPVPPSIVVEVRDQMERYGRLRIVRDPASDVLVLTSTGSHPALLEEVARDRQVAALLEERLDATRWTLDIGARGALKQALLRLGWPAADEAGYVEGSRLDELALTCALRGYQQDAVASWWAGGSPAGGNGVLVLPCGAGKTVIGLASLGRAGAHTLVLTTSILAARQWISELLDKTDIDAELVGEYSGERKEVRPITVATYQVVTWRDTTVPEDADVAVVHPHLGLFDREPWGLVIYDEVHLLPAPVFRVTARIQAVRRLGLTATLIREDGREGDVFSLIGPKRYDAPWRELESQGWIAPATCTEVRVDLPDAERMPYATAEPRARYRLAATSRAKLPVLQALMDRHAGDRILVIGQYLDQLREVGALLDAPVVTGRSPQAVREERFAEFREGRLPVLVVSKLANFAIDLPEANVLVQVSGAFGSREEEAQRLGRILRPKADQGQAFFYTVVARETVDQDFAAKRQRFLTEQGYAYTIVDAPMP